MVPVPAVATPLAPQVFYLPPPEEGLIRKKTPPCPHLFTAEWSAVRNGGVVGNVNTRSFFQSQNFREVTRVSCSAFSCITFCKKIMITDETRDNLFTSRAKYRSSTDGNIHLTVVTGATQGFSLSV